MIDVETYRDDLVRLGMHKVAHQDVTLVDHMFRACEILQDMKAAENICMKQASSTAPTERRGCTTTTWS